MTAEAAAIEGPFSSGHKGPFCSGRLQAFAGPQRRAVFRRDGGLYQLAIKCEGTKVKWDGWHCDHRLAWTEGGKKTVENGQVACAACNLSKGKREV